jgi:hypothetical protein
MPAKVTLLAAAVPRSFADVSGVDSGSDCAIAEYDGNSSEGRYFRPCRSGVARGRGTLFVVCGYRWNGWSGWELKTTNAE